VLSCHCNDITDGRSSAATWRANIPITAWTAACT